MIRRHKESSANIFPKIANFTIAGLIKKTAQMSLTSTTCHFCVQVDFVRAVTAGDQLREEDHLALETLLVNVPQSRTIKSNSLELTPSNTPQLSPATTPANKKNRLPIGNPSMFTCMFIGEAYDKPFVITPERRF